MMDQKEERDAAYATTSTTSPYTNNTNNSKPSTATNNATATHSDTPPLPPNWDRCHAYLERKRRYCRQMPVPTTAVESCTITFGSKSPPRYCGNHMHLMEEWKAAHTNNNGEESEVNGNKLKRPRHENETSGENNIPSHDSIEKNPNASSKNRGKRIPCPIDPSHLIFESALSKHVLICPAVKNKQEAASRDYYCEGINSGGFGKLSQVKSENIECNVIDAETSQTDELERAKELALAVLRVFCYLFLSKNAGESCTHISNEDKFEVSNDRLKSLSEEEIYNALPEMDMSSVEEGTSDSYCPPKTCLEVSSANDTDKVATMTSDSITSDNGEQNIGRLTTAIHNHRIKAGGPRHVQQIASILGHLRKKGLVPPVEEPSSGDVNGESTALNSNSNIDDAPTNIIEMGAGRGMLGLVVAGATGASLANAGRVHSTSSIGPKVRLFLVERSGTRAKAETKIRTAIRDAQKEKSESSSRFSHNNSESHLGPMNQEEQQKGEKKNGSSLRLDLVEVTRIKCDLAHVNMSTALPFLAAPPPDAQPSTTNSALNSNSTDSGRGRTLVVAKHLCGAGTDLALKSLRDISSAIDGCVMATCCHGLCTWKDYVGRDFLMNLFCGSVGGMSAFGEGDFDVLKRWTSASVLDDMTTPDSSIGGDDSDKREGMNDEHVCVSKNNKGPNIFTIVKELGLSCEGRGLGRACQRIIDKGRCFYMRNNLFEDRPEAFEVDLFHYVSRKVTPQNALLLASKIPS